MKDKEILSIHGGEPVRDSYLPYASQWIDDDDIQVVTDILKSDYLTTGPAITQFEEAIADFVGAKYGVAFSSGTAALHAACFAAEVNDNDEVITTPMTFAASSNCILYRGATPIFADIHPNTYNICPTSIQSLLTEKTKAIITVDFTGQPAEYEEILSLAKKERITVIEDAAHALGAKYKNKRIGSLADMTMFSFHPVKHITTGEGGMITTNSQQLYEKLLLFRSHGITRDPSKLQNAPEPWYYEMQQLGYNYRMTDIQAALGYNQLKKLNSFIEKRTKIAKTYTKAFEKLKSVKTPFQSDNCQSSWHLYLLRLNLEKLTTNRNEIFRALLKENIGVNVHYIPVYLHPYYQQLGYEEGLCPNAEKLYEEVITLPLFPKMTEKDVEDVTAGVRKVLSYYSV